VGPQRAQRKRGKREFGNKKIIRERNAKKEYA
jgi:hypothetical protein